MTKYFRLAGIILLTLAIILSCTVLGNRLTDPASYAHTIEVLDNNRSAVLGLAAASAAASAAVSAIPDDVCTPLAEEISELTTWFTIILAVVYLEKYLLTVLGAAACYILIPVGCAALLINLFFPKRILRSVGTKLVAIALAMLLVIPTGVWVSDRINSIYSRSIEATVESANAVSDNLFGEMQGADGESSTIIDEAKTLLGDLSGSVAEVIEQFKNVLNRFIEATAVMIVTTCLIPIIVIMFFVWALNTMFNIPIIVPTPQLRPGRRRRSREGEDEDEIDR